MASFHINLPGGGQALVLASGHAKCYLCDRPSEFLCDFLVAPGRTCSRRLCRFHAASVRKGTDFCEEHHQRWLEGEQRDVFPPPEATPAQHELFPDQSAPPASQRTNAECDGQ